MSDEGSKSAAANVMLGTGIDLARDPHRIQADSSMIASNIDASDRVAPSLSKISIIEDIYAFAAHLRAGSVRD